MDINQRIYDCYTFLCIIVFDIIVFFLAVRDRNTSGIVRCHLQLQFLWCFSRFSCNENGDLHGLGILCQLNLRHGRFQVAERIFVIGFCRICIRIYGFCRLDRFLQYLFGTGCPLTRIFTLSYLFVQCLCLCDHVAQHGFLRLITQYGIQHNLCLCASGRPCGFCLGIVVGLEYISVCIGFHHSICSVG